MSLQVESLESFYDHLSDEDKKVFFYKILEKQSTRTLRTIYVYDLQTKILTKRLLEILKHLGSAESFSNFRAYWCGENYIHIEYYVRDADTMLSVCEAFNIRIGKNGGELLSNDISATESSLGKLIRNNSQYISAECWKLLL
jgi:hypothetical protein